MSESVSTMSAPRITKITVHIGVGEGGQRLLLAERVLELLTGLTSVRTIAKSTNRDVGTREGAPIGCKVTIRDAEIIDTFLKDAFWVREQSIHNWSFDEGGNLSFGIKDYTDFPKQKYDPEIGIFGMDINIVLERPGHRVSRRRRRKAKVGGNHRVSREECMAFFAERYKVSIVEA
jgi:large subunit ribosomal protein L5